MNVRRFTLPIVGAAALAAVGLTASSAGAHVTVTPDTTSAGAYAVLTFSVGHGCEGSPTTGLRIALPEQIPAVTPTINPGWSVEKVNETLDEPITDAHGNEVTERVSEVVYTAKTPLVDGFRDTVELSVQLPDAADETLAFPVVQTCEKGETRWVETTAAGADAEELELPAPTITLTAGGDGGHGAEAGGDTGGETGEAATSAEGGDSQGLAIGGLVAGVGGLLLGGAALLRSRKA